MTTGNEYIRSVLIVEDDRTMRMVSKAFFEDLNVPEILEAENGFRALDVLVQRDKMVDLIICDLQMPEMDGFQFLRQLNKHEFKGPIVILSGFEKSVIELAKDLAENHNLSIVGALQKPLDPDALNNIYQFLVDKKREEKNEQPSLLKREQISNEISVDDMVTCYQPKISLKTGQIVGVEALDHWRHPVQGLVDPDHFLDQLDNPEIVKKLIINQIKSVFQDMHKCLEIKSDFKVSSNVTLSVLHDIDFPDFISALMSENNLKEPNLILEINADMLPIDNTAIVEVIARLRILGVEFALDHIGYESPDNSHVQSLPFSELKLCKSIIKSAYNNADHARKVVSYVEYGKQHDWHVTAVGAETSQDLEFLARKGVDGVQGYFPAKAMPIDEMLQWLKEYESRFRTN